MNAIGVLVSFKSRTVKVLLVCALGFVPSVLMAQQTIWPDSDTCKSQPSEDPDVRGWCLVIDQSKGNCLACHTFNISPWPSGLPVAGNIAPPMVAMAPRFPDETQLKKQIEDATAFNINSTMPPYLPHKILSPEEIDLIVQFLLKI